MTPFQVPLGELSHVDLFPTRERLARMRDYSERLKSPIRLRRLADGTWQLVDRTHRIAIARELGEATILAANDETHL